MTTFAALGVPADLVAALAAEGIDTPFPIQTLSIPDGLAGRDVCGKAETGSGKTLAFGLPLLARISAGKPKQPAGLILVPTRELAVQVADALAPLAKATGRRVVAVYGGAPMERQTRALDKAADVVVATPGRLIDLVDRGDAELGNVEVLVVDEVDRMVDMGFLPQVEWLLRHVTSEHQTLVFSATLDGEVGGFVRVYLQDAVLHEVDSEAPTVDSMTHRFLKVHEMDKAKVAAAIARRAQRTIVFSRTKRGADRLTRTLVSEGLKVEALHGDLPQARRQKALRRFSEGEVGVLVATDVAARGIHVEGVDVVVHYDVAEDHKAYLHRSGRTARAGASGVAVTLALWNEELDVTRLQRRLGLEPHLVEMFSNDDRLADLAAFQPEPMTATGTDGGVAPRVRPGARRRR